MATGRALLAYQTEEEIDAVLAEPLVAYTQHTITDPARLREEPAHRICDMESLGVAIRRPPISTSLFIAVLPQ